MQKAIVIGLIVLAFFMGYSLDKEALPETEMPYNGVVSDGLSPNDWISQDKIRVYPHYVRIDLRNALWSNFTNTHSMVPVLGSKSNAIQVKPKSENDICIGDIISFRTEKNKIRVIHRVIGIGQDTTGKYFVTKGDNNKEEDPYKVRFSQIERVVVAVIY